MVGKGAREKSRDVNSVLAEARRHDRGERLKRLGSVPGPLGGPTQGLL